MYMTNTVNEKLFLKEVQLSGYKSIDNVSIDFKRGLNIIIGKNAAGKTNFLKFLSKNLSLDYKDLNNFTAKLVFKNGKDVEILASRNIEIQELINHSNLSSKVNSVLSISKKIVKDKKDKNNDLAEKLLDNNIIFDSTFLCHGIPKEYPIVDTPYSFKITKDKVSNDVSNLFWDKTKPYFLKSLAIDIVLDAFRIKDFNIDSIKECFNLIFLRIAPLQDILNKYSPIEDLRFSENFNVFIEEDKENFNLSNLFLEFKINGNWLPYSNLSDGTKRLFYIISEVFEFETGHIRPSSNGTFYGLSDISRIVLIEEPELGIHPHQFHKLMEFLKEESEKKQIILTTHSPQALDAIESNQLDKIIIAYSTNSKEGTKLRHLNSLELTKANEYIKEDFLSDYWLYSDLEK